MNDGAAVNPDGSIETERDTINRLVKNRDELVQHLQSQKEEIEQLKFNLDIHVKAVNVEYESQSQIESLKAITELAVKGLKSITDHTGPKTGEDAWEMFQEAEYTLSEIARLSHEHNS